MAYVPDPRSCVAALLIATLGATTVRSAAEELAPPEANATDQRANRSAPPPSAASRIVLARFATGYAHDAEHKARASNVELAAEAVNGHILSAGGTFSFNAAVGERTAAFGYARSIVLRDGMIAEGMGGGACQVASTLHAAALLAGLEVVTRAPHSRPSAYIRMGLDATVAMGPGAATIDLKLKNPGSVSVTLHARAARGALEIWVEAPGAARPEVSLSSEILERTAFPRVVERDKHAAEDVVRVKALGIPGFRVKRTREIRAADGRVRRDVRIDVYPPTPETVVVAPSFDESRINRRSLGSRASSRQGGQGEEGSAGVRVVIDSTAARPVAVQLRPSTLVVLDNAAR